MRRNAPRSEEPSPAFGIVKARTQRQIANQGRSTHRVNAMLDDAKRINDGADGPVKAPPRPHDPEWSPTIVRIPDAMASEAPRIAAAPPKRRLSLMRIAAIVILI